MVHEGMGVCGGDEEASSTVMAEEEIRGKGGYVNRS